MDANHSLKKKKQEKKNQAYSISELVSQDLSFCVFKRREEFASFSGLFGAECLDSCDGTAEDEGVDVMGAFVGIDRF